MTKFGNSIDDRRQSRFVVAFAMVYLGYDHHNEVGVGEEVEFVQRRFGYVYFGKDLKEPIHFVGDFDVHKVEYFSNKLINRCPILMPNYFLQKPFTDLLVGTQQLTEFLTVHFSLVS